MKMTAQRNTLTFTVLIALLAIATLTAQDAPRSGTYKIQSGAYIVDSISGPRTVLLPDAYQAFVSVLIGPGDSVAELTFVGTNRQAVFLRLTNGIVTGSSIRFQYVGVHPYRPTRPAQIDYVATIAAGRLWISGSISMISPMPDFPNRLQHDAVSATVVPALSIRLGNGVELRWSSATNQQYQVQCLSELTNLCWTNLGTPMQGNGSTMWSVDALAPFQTQRLYRILILP